LPPVLKDEISSDENDVEEGEEEEYDDASKKHEMAESTVKTSPTWMIFKTDESDDLKVNVVNFLFSLLTVEQNKLRVFVTCEPSNLVKYLPLRPGA
jgi:hypothetical protein